MEFTARFITADIKYDFISFEHGQQQRQNWVKCRLNIKSPDMSNIDINCYPLNYNDDIPLEINIDFPSVRCEMAISGSKKNVFALIWSYENQECRYFIAIDDSTVFNVYFQFMKNLLKVCSIARIEQETAKKLSEWSDDYSPTSTFSVASFDIPIKQVRSKKSRFSCVKQLTKKAKNKLKPLLNILSKTKCKFITCKNTKTDNVSLNSYESCGNSIETSQESFSDESNDSLFMVSKDVSLDSMQLEVSSNQSSDDYFPLSVRELLPKNMFIENDGLSAIIEKNMRNARKPSFSEQSNLNMNVPMISGKSQLFQQIYAESIADLYELCQHKKDENPRKFTYKYETIKNNIFEKSFENSSNFNQNFYHLAKAQDLLKFSMKQYENYNV